MPGLPATSKQPELESPEAFDSALATKRSEQLAGESEQLAADREQLAVDRKQLTARREQARDAIASTKPRRRPRQETFTLGRYVVTGRIASGGMATVYRARLEGQGGFAREFAVKVIHPHLAAADGFKQRFLDEARVASRVNHPNVVATIDSDQDRGYHFLVLELVDGVTLRQLFVNDLHRSPTNEGARLSPDEAARILCDAARGLHAVHTVVDEHGEALDVIHRDLSPHNLMLDATGRTVLIDLGLAKARGQLGHTQTGVLCGKLPYMSPEQSRMQTLDARSDVFSLGSVLFELAAGEAPFGDDHTPGTLDALRVCDVDRLAERLVAADVPSWLTQIVLRCLRRDPDDRYPSAAALADALDDAMRRAGVIQSEARQRLAARVRTVRQRVGAEQPAEPLPPLITADTTGSHRAIPPVSYGGRLRGLAMAGVGALVVLVGVFLFNAFGILGVFDQRSATPRDESSTPSLSADTNLRSPEREPAPTRAEPPPPKPAPQAALSPTEADTDGPVDPPQATEPARKRKGSRGGKAKLDEFKANPYD